MTNECANKDKTNQNRLILSLVFVAASQVWNNDMI